VSGNARVGTYDVATGRPLRSVTLSETALNVVTLSPDARRVAGAGEDHLVRVWDADSGRQLLVLKAHTDRVDAIALSADGHRLASTGADGKVCVWDGDSGRQLHMLPGHPKQFGGLALSPDGRRLASWGEDGTLRVWDADMGKEMHVLRGPHRLDGVVAFSPDGRRLACARGDGSLRLFDTDSGREQRAFQGHSQARSSVLYSLVFSPDGRRLATAGGDSTVRLWDAVTGQELLLLKGHKDAAQWLAFSGDGLRLAAWARNSLLVWEAGSVPADDWRRRGLVNRVHAFFEAGLLREEVVAALAKVPALGESDRPFALQVAQNQDVNLSVLNEAAWKVVAAPGAGKADYARALRQAEAAAGLGPGQANILNTLGIAQYRVGRYAEALATLARAEEIEAKLAPFVRNSQPSDLAFMAMAEHRLGKKVEARATLGRLREVVKQPTWAANAEAQGFLREAQALIEGKAAGKGR
jgi:hypothetical protein